MPNPYKIILAEDDRPLAELFGLKLEKEGFSVIYAENGEEVLSKARETKPDLILLDVMMPKKDGIETIIELKDDAALQKIPVVFLTNIGNKIEDRKAAQELGAVDLILKSVATPQDVIVKVNEILSAKTTTSTPLPKSKSGQGIIELLIALAIITLGIGFAIILVFGGQKIVVDRDNSAQARAWATEGLEGAVVAVKNNWNGIADGTYGVTFSSGTWQLTGSEDVTSVFTRQVTVSTTVSNQREIKSTVTWLTDPSRPEQVQFVTLVTNFDITIETGGDTGGGGISGDWLNPRTLGTVDLGPGNQATDLDVKSRIVYMSASAASAAKPDFFVIDAANGESPSIISSVDTGPSLNGVDVANTYAYVANDLNTAQLQVIDVSNLATPLVKVSFRLTGVSGVGAVGKSIFYLSSKVYIGTKTATGPEFHVVDVSNPLSPTELGSFEIGADVNDIYVVGTTVYLATSNNSKELVILNVANPASIAEIGSFDASGNDDGKSVFMVSPKLYLGTEALYVLDVSNPAAIQNLGSKDIDASINDSYVKDYLAFLGTDDSNKEFQVLNITDPANIQAWSSFNFPQVVTGIDYEDNLVYSGVRSNDALRIITSSP
ncbi:response regulator [Candidatus Jorgensenbacteria bacterium]|nr:response regulator [Candidatus Jorgensenbacteria bacterium]